MKLMIYMKSGNVITVRGVSKYTIRNRGDEIVGITFEKNWWCQGTGLLLNTLALSQIEAVCVS